MNWNEFKQKVDKELIKTLDMSSIHDVDIEIDYIDINTIDDLNIEVVELDNDHSLHLRVS